MKNYAHFLFITFEVWENKVTLLLSVLAYFLRYGHFMDFTPIQQQKPILQCIFQNFDREREFCKNLPLFLILRAYLNHRIYKESILWCVKNQYFWHSTIGKYWQWVLWGWNLGGRSSWKITICAKFGRNLPSAIKKQLEYFSQRTCLFIC